jgi:hypothetical protein
MEFENIQIHLNSKLATNYINNSLSNCEFYLPTLECPPEHSLYISVVSASIPYTFYNVDETNNYFSCELINGNGDGFYFDKGNYNAYQITNFLNNNLSNGIKCSYNIISNKMVLTHPSSNFLLHQTSTCLELLGFKSSDSVNKMTSSGLELTSNYCVNLQTKHCICIQTNFETGNRNFSNLLSSNILASIPISGNPYSMISYINPNKYRCNLFSNIIRYINVKLVDQNNNLLNLNGCHFSLTLQLDIEKFTE